MKTLSELEKNLNISEMSLKNHLLDKVIDMELVWLLKIHIHSLNGLMKIHKGENINPDNLRIVNQLRIAYRNCKKKEIYENTKRNID